jgi:uncharacterized protein YecE (DUF72 family)
VDRTPGGFRFTVKASRYLTHVKRLRGIGDGLKRFLEPLEPLRASGKLGPILWQLPGNFTRDDARLEELLAALPEGPNCIEFRHPTWFDREVYEALSAHGIALVIGDDPQRPFTERRLTTDWTLIRFHRGRRGRNGNYSSAELLEWRRRIAQWRRRAEVFAYFNNDWKGYAPRNAVGLRDGVGPRRVFFG